MENQMNGISRQFRCARMALVLATFLWCTALLVEVRAAENGVETAAENPAGTQIEAESSTPPKEESETSRSPAAVSGPSDFSLDQTPEEFESSYISVMAKLGVALGFVVLLAWATMYLLRKSRIGQQFGATGGSIRVVERAYLGPKKQICLVEVGGRALALGVTEENISLLAEWPAGELDLAAPAETPGLFAVQLKKLIGQMREQPAHQERG